MGEAMNYTETKWVEAAILVGEAAERVQQQRESVEENRRRGFSTLLSEEALASMLYTLHLLRDHLAKIEADLEREGNAALGGLMPDSKQKGPPAMPNGTEEAAAA
jgi:hypothetical protein